MFRAILIIFVGAFLMVAPGICSSKADVDDLVKRARQGDTQAMCDLGIVYYNGDGVLKDPFKAKCWVKKAHDLGEPRAQKIWNDLKLWQYSGKCSIEFDDRPLPDHASGEIYREPVTGMLFVWIPGKCFQMGCSQDDDEDCKKDDVETQRVCLEGYWMGQYEVTQEQWMTLMQNNPSRFKGKDFPVEQVSFRDIDMFISRLNQKTGKWFTLPSEAQWEFACTNRGRREAYPWGKEIFRPPANCAGCDTGGVRGRTAPVGSYLPNNLGLYDMGGNVREWCRTVYDQDNGKQAGKKEGRQHKKGKHKKDANASRVVRGGSFIDPFSSSRCRSRNKALPGMRTYFTGFRLVLKEKD
ncbi:MAG: SUMF1/EgtB/PvdO family nonheme iron enzyme [Desulfobacterales bacterium]|nr:SUMF1/EgtB/PvdO family nonheme iron enzyme [Desulfobacterales bacterium]